MKKLISTLVLFVLIIACRQESNTNSVKEDVIKKVVTETQKQIDQKKEQTVEEFLVILKDALQNNDLVKIKELLTFPFEGYYSEGEDTYYSNFNSLTFSNEVYETLTNLQYATKIEAAKNKEMFWITIKLPNGYEYSNLYRIVKNDTSFKLAGMMLPY